MPWRITGNVRLGIRGSGMMSARMPSEDGHPPPAAEAGRTAPPEETGYPPPSCSAFTDAGLQRVHVNPVRDVVEHGGPVGRPQDWRQGASGELCAAFHFTAGQPAGHGTGRWRTPARLVGVGPQVPGAVRDHRVRAVRPWQCTVRSPSGRELAGQVREVHAGSRALT